MAGRYNLRQTTVIERAKRAAAPAPAPPRRPRNAAATAAAKPAAAPKRKAGAPAGRGRPKKKPATKAAKGRGRARDADSEDDELEDDDQDNNDGPPFAEPPAADPPVAEPPAADPPAEERDLGGDNAEGRDNGTLDEENRLEEERLQEGARERERREEEEGNRREDERIQEEIRERERREEEEKKQREEEEAKERERREMAPPDRDQTLDENPPGGNDEPPPEKPRSGGAAAGAENATGDDNATGGGIAAARDSGAAAGDENAAQSNGAAAGDNKAPGSGGATAGVGVTTGATAGAGGEDDLRDYESYEAQERDQDRPISPVYEPTSPGPPSLTQYWDNFMAQFLDDQQELRLKWRPLRSRALLLEALTEGVGETTEVEPPMYIDELHYERTLSDLNAADLDRFGPLADRPNFTSFDDPTHPHCAEHRYNEWAMTMIWAQHAAKLNSTAGKDEATWCCHRAVIQLQSLEDRDRWILPDDDEDDPLIPAKTFLDGMGPENVRMNPLKARALDILSLGVRVAPHLQGKWYKLDFLGAGGFGRAYAYGQYDDRGRLCDVSSWLLHP
ncbi:hypothetical protein BDY17DRAFT_158117 [Neohortaea acidophila]|uniref:Uncharacterized protein n=1 Tax=Neohortaea acidophila TaxID=245834 RepID=A0A6A6PQN3_9PEZI|nr:uncharacterized protein BDY17DRAFT_158117 [Neohortaea acidophila]KAF2482322.1 hypothetical protein BDY17DRAFT_158117 [Neohortaea acidophila]